MNEYEKAWAKENGLKRTNLRVYERDYPCERIVYRAKDGRLYYRNNNMYCGASEEYCYTKGECIKRR